VKDTDDDLELESFDFNFDIDAVDKSINNGTQKNITQPEANNLTIAEKYKLPVNSGTDSEIAASPLINSDPTQEDSFSEFDFSFDFDTPLENKDSEFSKDSDFFDLNVSDLTDMDEYETKIDLAKAYVDMGDATAAKVIAEEVLGKGTRDQKLAAQALLDELR
jgi:pilus assembly protein FimV